MNALLKAAMVTFYFTAVAAALTMLVMMWNVASSQLAEGWRSLKRKRRRETVRDCEPPVFVEMLLLYRPDALHLRKFIAEQYSLANRYSAYQLSFLTVVNEQYVRYRTMIDFRVFPSALECGTLGFVKETSKHWLDLPLLVRIFSKLIYKEQYISHPDPIGWYNKIVFALCHLGFNTKQQSDCGQIDDPIAIIEKVLRPHVEAAVA